MSHSHDHFKGKDVIEHVAEAQAQGIISLAEMHGTEAPGHLVAGAEAVREIGAVLLLLFVALMPLHLSFVSTFSVLTVFSTGMLIWKTGRSSWLGWSRLERLHRLVEQERWEIEHHRQQERDELRVLYAAKGFEGKLLEEVLDVLMADGDRLLRVMVEEEMGFTLESQEHPLKQGIGAALGSALAAILCLAGLVLSPLYGLPIAAFLSIAIGGFILAKQSQNRLIAALIWNIGIASLSLGFVYFLGIYVQ